jgi:alpha-glucosidase (family GH31 glycosyl hydrolase)
LRAHWSTVGPFAFRLEVSAPDPQIRRLALALRRDPAVPLYGFGSRTNGTFQQGVRVENWVQEGGNGKSEHPLFGVSNYPTASHVPVPFCLSPAGFGLSIEGAERSVWDVGTSRPDELGIEIDAGHLAVTFDLATEPADILKAYTARKGRPSMPPEWAFAPTEWGKGGTAAVLAKAQRLRREGVPASGIWFEDWVGLEHGPLPGLTHLPWGRWVPDPQHYPGLREMNQTLERMGFKSLGYFNPFLSQADPYAQPALRAGFALTGRAGRPHMALGPYGYLGHIDPTHPGARAWAFKHLADFERLGFDGAMVDFGEWVPPDARFADGSTGWQQHNRYPDLWSGLHRAFWQQARPDGDYVFYTRAGWTGAARNATYMWAGDQNTNWGDDDGFPTALRAILSAGLSGIPLMTHDVAGFATLGEEGVTKELYARWVAFGAFSTFMRSHSGQKPSRNWHIFSDAETLALHRKFARAHMDLLPYRQAVVQEAVKTGLPAMRHLMLAYPEDRVARTLDDTYMLGPDLLVAPIFTAGATQRRVWLPRGTWYDYWTRRRHAGEQWLTVPAPLDALPVFARAGAILPLLPPGILTTLPSHDPAVPGREAYAQRRVIRVFAGPASTFSTAEGIMIAQRSPQGATGRLHPLKAFVNGRAVPVVREGGYRSLNFKARGGEVQHVRLGTAAGPWTLRWHEPAGPERHVTLQVVAD